MPLAPGARLGPYEIISAIGAGGMGEVYRAKDTRLDRTVAIKVLPQAFAIDTEFRERFAREAKVISSLDHPNICALYDVGEDGGIAFLVMQYLEGETLEQRLVKGALQSAQALKYAIEIADALDRAHRQGIVHRDLKPGNIMITRAGARVLDFGLAKVGAANTSGLAASGLPTTPPNLTAQGAILGTFQYMAPEQLEGGEVDARSDIFAFGAVLYEMLTGRKAFEGKSQASLIAAILTSTPALISSLQPLTPPALDRIVTTCLAKEPDERWQNANDLVRELRWIKDSGSTAAASSTGAPVVHIPRHAIGWTLAAAAMVGVLVGGSFAAIAGFGRARTTMSDAVNRVLISVEPASRLRSSTTDDAIADGRPSRTAMAISPDGRAVVFSAVRDNEQRLYVRWLDRLDATSLEGTEGGRSPFFSPDGKFVGFWVQGVAPGTGTIKKVALTGGPPTAICESPSFVGGSWSSNDQVVFAHTNEGLFVVAATGGIPQPLTTLDSSKEEFSHRLPHWLPGKAAVMFTVLRRPFPRWDDTQVVVYTLADKTRRVVVDGGADARYVSSGHVVYMRQGTLMAVPFNLERLEPAGGAVGLLGNVMQAANMGNPGLNSGAGQFSVSGSGDLVYLTGGMFPDYERTMVWFDRNGKGQPVSAPPKPYLAPHISPAGDRVALFTQGADGNSWVYDLRRGALTKVTESGAATYTIWTPDGAHIALTDDGDLLRKTPDGTGAGERLVSDAAAPSSWTPDAQTLLFVRIDPTTRADIWALSMADRKTRPIIQTNAQEEHPEISPDGRWLAYTSDVSGRQEVYVQPFPAPGDRTQVSTGGGNMPMWSRTSELFYTMTPPQKSDDFRRPMRRLMSVPYSAGPRFAAGTPRALFEERYSATTLVRGYDITADGQRFLMTMEKERPPVNPNQMILVQNWVHELKQRVPLRK